MEYQLIAEITAPQGAPELDPLQQLGVVTLIDEQLDTLAGVDGPDGVAVEPLDHQVSGQPDGAVVTMVVEAPALAFAEDGARAVLGELLAETPLLPGWQLTRCAVTASDADLVTAVHGDGDQTAEKEEEAAEEGQDLAERRTHLLSYAERLRALGPELFGTEDEEVTEGHAAYLAGALLEGLEILTDELFADIQILRETEEPVSEQDGLWVLDQLPGRYAERYTALFAQQFLVTTAILGHRLCGPEWPGPSCPAEALALHLVKSLALGQLDLAGLLDELPVERMLAAFDARVFANLDHEWLYEPDESHGPAFEDWFSPYPEQEGIIHPYLIEEPAEQDA
ncbi:hypothetical protein [Sciscionella sediminilitoris]|uniref:hypothetical protein n=1 Tax=Sciscionella sediminilitoris TaxID=1445613 RepID=UPI0004DED6A8|nr:hypothetical protein [Sciscionella sp. SE31]